MSESLSDLEMTKRCAEAMGLEIATTVGDRPITTGKDEALCCFAVHPIWGRGGILYRPLHDDAQCFALVKHLHLSVLWNEFDDDQKWHVTSDSFDHGRGYDANLNRAVVEVVAKMRASSDGQEERHVS